LIISTQWLNIISKFAMPPFTIHFHLLHSHVPEFIKLENWPPNSLRQGFSTFLLPRNPTQAWRSLTEPHALIRESNNVCEDEATECLWTHFPSRAEFPWGWQSRQRWSMWNL